MAPQGVDADAFRILLVDDDADVRGVVARVLKRLGHTVLACGTEREAETCTEPFEVAMIDFNLGGAEGSGLVLLQRMRSHHPNCCFVLTSGSRPNLPDNGPRFLPKPFSRSDLVALFESIRRERRPN